MAKDDHFWLMVSYITGALIFSYVYWLAFEAVGIQTDFLELYDWYRGSAIAGSLLLGALTIYFVSRDKDREEYFLNSIGELRKVTWPSLEDTRKMTIIVCVVVAIFAGILFVFDVVWARVLKLIIA